MLGLPSIIPLPYKVLAIAVVVVGAYVSGASKGMKYEHDKFAAQQGEILAKERADAAKLNKDLSAQLFASDAAKSAAEARAKKSNSALAIALSKAPASTSKECEVSVEVKDTLNAKTKNTWRDQK